jgi:hypothetical protein
MAAITKYAGYSNPELLQLLSDKREYSEVIDELCKRVETDAVDTCPICDGDIGEFLGDQE